MRVPLYNAVWRWHFYAGLLTLPFLVSLAVTGGIYLFKDEIEAVAYRELVEVAPRGAERALPSQIAAAAAASVGGAATGYLPPAAPDRAARVYVETASGARDVFVDPNTGAVLGSLPKGDYGNLPALSLVRNLHSLAAAGWIGNRVIELVAGWTLVLTVTGVYLWWPRGRSGGVVTVRRRAGARTFWRDLHAVIGVFAAVFVLFLAATGLPWSGFWGEHVKSAMNSAGLGYPAGYWFPVAQSAVPLDRIVAPTPWALGGSPVPESQPSSAQPIGLDLAVEIFEQRGIQAGYTIALPIGPTGVYTASVVPAPVRGARAIHVDQYSGRVLFDARYEDLGAAARAIELGTSIHMGREFGRLNRWIMLLACVAIVGLALSAATMWWRRRPKGGLGAPPRPKDFRLPRTVLLVAAAIGIVFPLVGASIIVMLTIDLLLPEGLRRRIG